MRIGRFLCLLLLSVGILTFPVPSPTQVAVGVSVRIGPPALPLYVQPICPGPGYLWVPGYWAYGPDGYFWVPGTWVEPPEVGLLWTPGYWGSENDFYIWHAGYWGPEVGYYGGISYGFGYTGVGFFGGHWRGGTYYYNRAVTNVNVAVVRNTYNTTVINNTTVNRVSFNGGSGGTTARPTSREMDAARQRHISMTSEQTQHQQAASANRTFLASVNHGRPDVAASVRPGQFNGRGAVESGRSASPNRAPENPTRTNKSGDPSPSARSANPDRPPSLRTTNAAPVNPALEHQHQQELDRLHQQQAQERQRIEQRHQQEQQKLQQRAADDRKQEEIQRKHQQQLQQLDRKHEQQQQKLQQKQQQEKQKQQRPEKPPSPSRPS
jgi:WXXGXW repeat (2 copies)